MKFHDDSFISQLAKRLSHSSLFKDSFWALLGSVLGKGLSLLAGIIVARFLGREIYGEYGLIKTTLLNISIFSTLGLGYTGTRYVAKAFEESRDEIKHILRVIYRITYASSSFMALLLFVFAQPVAYFIKAPDMSNALRLTSIIIILNAVNTSQIGIMSGLKQFRRIAINNTYAGILTFVTSSLFTYLWGLNGSLLSLFVSMLFNAVINNISIRNVCKPFGDKGASKYSTKDIINFSIPIALQESLYSIVGWLGSYLIITYANYGELGINSAAMQWSAVILFIPGVFKNVLLSYFSSTQDTYVLRKRMILVNFTATFVPWIFIILFSRFISSFYGDSYTNLNIVLIVGCLTPIFSSVSSVIIYEFISKGENWRVFFIRFFRDVCTLLLSWYCLSQYVSIQASIMVNIVSASVACLFMIILILSIISYDKKRTNISNEYQSS